MLGKKEVEEIKKVSLSAKTIERGIDNMSSDILETLINKLKTSGCFFFRLTKPQILLKSTVIRCCGFCRRRYSIREEDFFCKKFSKETTDQEIFRVTNKFFTANVSIGIKLTASTFVHMELQLWWVKEEVLLHW